jgi:hypothetical protein
LVGPPAPDIYTADDVMALLTRRGLRAGLREWELLTGLTVTIYVGETRAEGKS